MDLIDQLLTIDVKGRSNIINFIEFYSQKPQSIVPNLLGNNHWQNSTYNEISVKSIARENTIVNLCRIPNEPFVEENNIFYDILYGGAATVVVVPGLGSLIHNAFWHYIVGNEKFNPMIPLFILAENPTNLSIEECKHDIYQQLDLDVVWLREFEFYALIEDKKISWNRFVTRLVKKVIDFLIVTNIH